MDPRLQALKRTPWAPDPRYYPPGQHPAMSRIRAQVDQLKLFVAISRGSPQATELIEYLQDQLAAFEELETEHKYRDLKMLEDRERW